MNKDSNGQSMYLAKTRLQHELEYSINFNLLAEILIEWKKLKPENKELIEMAQALTKIGVYVASIQMEQNSFERICSQYRLDKLKHQKEALESAEKLQEYEKKYFEDTGN